MSPRKKQDNQVAPLWVEEGETTVAPLVTVAPAAPIDKTYTFTADEGLLADLRLGQRVMVPFGRRSRLAPGFVVNIERGAWSSTLKKVDSIVDRAGQLSEHLLELGTWIARYYCCPLGRTLAAMVPEAVRRQSGFVTVRQVTLNGAAAEAYTGRLGPKQRGIIEALRGESGAVEEKALLAAAGTSRAALRSLMAKGLVAETETREAPEVAQSRAAIVEPDFELNEDQNAALEHVAGALDQRRFRALLLHGVSGSGKTEVYIRAMRRVLAAGMQTIMLVPEIALTTQLMNRLAERFERVAVIHSGLTSVERSLMWQEIATGKTPVVIGTRSAVFAPCPNLGLVVVDEEQDTSYKNLQSPRFHVRDVAIKRAHHLDIPIVLGSATPSLETWENVKRLPTYERVTLPRRVSGLSMPEVRIVDMLEEPRVDGEVPTISRPLRDALATVLEARFQAVLLLNRRGYATWLYCPKCDLRINCPNCKASLVLHRTRNQLVCHHCHTTTKVPRRCPDPSCRSPLARGGGGTERLEAELQRYFPTARVQRADSDVMTDARSYRKLIDDFDARRLDVLLGTQMIAKGLDFPIVALVGVIGAELTAAVADFRASERLFQLVTQVAGRAGRAGVAGRVIVQSNSPTLPALRFATRHDFDGFAEAELPLRKQFGLPPFTRLARFVLAGPRDLEVAAETQQLAERLRECIARLEVSDADVRGPHPCAIERIKGSYRHEVTLRARGTGPLLQVLDTARHAGLLKTRAQSMIVDVDPVSLT